MDEIRAATPVEEADGQASRPWLRAILSAAVFGGIGAAAANWLSLHSQPIANRARVHLTRNWATGVVGIGTGAIAMYGTLHATNDAPPGIDNVGPSNEVQGSTVQHSDKVKALSPGERSL